GERQDLRHLLRCAGAQHDRGAPLVHVAHLAQVGELLVGVGERVLRAHDGREAGDEIGAQAGKALRGMLAHAGLAARRSRSLMASPRPCCGIGITAIALVPVLSSVRRAENRLAAASTRSPDQLRLSISPWCGGTFPEPNASSASSGCTSVA